MSFKLKMTSIALASAMTMGIFALPAAASAEVGYSATLSSMYLWRGQNISDGAPALSGDISYSHASGFYAFGWMSSEGVSEVGGKDGGEVDVGLGYAGKAGPVDYDISYYKYWYPEEDTENGTSFGDAGAEIVLAGTFKDITAKVYLDAKDSDDYTYYTVSGSVGKIGLLYGVQDSKTANADYSHFDITFNATEKLSFTISTPTSVGSASGVDKDSIFMMSYSLPVGK